MANWLQRFTPKSAFARGVGVLVGGTAGAQLISVLAAPLLTRLYSPEAFGILAAFSAILALCLVAAAGRYELAIPIPEKEDDAANLAALSVCIALVFTALASIVFVLFREEIAGLLNVPQLAELLWILPIGILAGISYEIFSKWSLRKRNYKAIAKTRLMQSIATLFVQVLGSPFGAVALVVGQAAGQGVGTVRLALSAARDYSWGRCNLSGAKAQASKFRRYPQYSLWSGLLNTSSLQLAPLVFVAAYGPVVAGLYALTLRVLSMPGGLIGNAIGNVFLAEAPSAIRSGALKPLVSKLHNNLAKAAALPAVVITLFGKDLFGWVFGASWAQAGLYAQMMAPWIYLQFQWAPLSMIGNLLELQKQILVAHILNLAIRLAVLTACVLLAVAADNAVLLFSIVSALVYLLMIVWFFGKAGLTFGEIVSADVKYIALTLLVCAPIWIYFNTHASGALLSLINF